MNAIRNYRESWEHQMDAILFERFLKRWSRAETKRRRAANKADKAKSSRKYGKWLSEFERWDKAAKRDHANALKRRGTPNLFLACCIKASKQ